MKSPQPLLHSLPHMADFSLGEDIDLVIGLTAAALAGNEIVKVAQSHQHHGSHLVKAGLSAALAAGALKMLQREHRDNQKHHNNRSREHTQYHHSRSTLEGNERHQHQSKSSTGHHNQTQSSRDEERHYDYHHERHLDQREYQPHHHRRHSSDSMGTSRSLLIDHRISSCNDRFNGTNAAQLSESDHSAHRSHVSHKAARTPSRLVTRGIGLDPSSSVRSHDAGHHVHFTNDGDISATAR